MNTPPNLRVCDEDNVDVQTLVCDALTQMNLTYAMLAAVVMNCEPHNSKLPVLIAHAQAANSQMLSLLRHPAGGA
jgi:hypothetical protein